MWRRGARVSSGDVAESVPAAGGPVNDPEAYDPGADGRRSDGERSEGQRPDGQGSDGQHRPEGQLQRQALLEAALRVIERDGAAGITHRTVAQEAQLPATAAFESPDALLTATLTSAMELETERLRELTAAPADGPGAAGGHGDKRRMLARLTAGALADRGPQLAEFELCLLAARRPELRGHTRRWSEALADFARLHTQDPMRVALFIRAYEGLRLQALLADEPPAAEEFEAMLWELLPDEG
ncbi:TetR/AcrR family transcriptional regulator [Streptomyces chrestomyceticus]|uniref:TetR/AcrR family transcriptional regulator n=1 Tax=Streptomyces chrestomyceticus TaxID=68185 RepID=UPI0037A20B0C